MTRRSCIIVILLCTASVFGQDDFSIDDFTRSPTEHVINRIDEPFVVRSVRGFITSPGVRDEFAGVLFEIQGPGSSKMIRKCVTDKKGQFKIADVPEGIHFKATMNGWQSVIGTIKVSTRASKGSAIKIEMRLGV